VINYSTIFFSSREVIMCDKQADVVLLQPSAIYTVSQKKLGHVLRPITLEILNRSLPNWA